VSEWRSVIVNPAAGMLSPAGQAGSLEWLATGNGSMPTSTAWPAANLAIFFPLYVIEPVTIYRVSWENGATANGNIDVGLYEVGLNRLVNTGTVAQAGTSTIQTADLADTTLKAGTYWGAIQGSATTITMAVNTGAAYRWRTASFAEQAVGSFGLPANATFAAYTRAFGLNVSYHFHNTV